MKSKEQKRAEALERQKEFEKFSTKEKFERLHTRGHWHCKEARKYRDEIWNGYLESEEA